MSFAWDISLGIVRLGTLALDLSLGSFLVNSAQATSPDNFHLGYFAWGLSRDSSTLELSLGNFHLEYLARDLRL